MNFQLRSAAFSLPHEPAARQENPVKKQTKEKKYENKIAIHGG
jgi:hypothetical protein